MLNIHPETFNQTLKNIALSIAREVLVYITSNSGELAKQDPDPRYVLVLDSIINKDGVASSTDSISGDGLDLQHHQAYIDIMLPIVINSLNVDSAKVILGEWANPIKLTDLLELSLDRRIDSDEYRRKFESILEPLKLEASHEDQLFNILIEYIRSLGTYTLLQTKDIVDDLLTNIITTVIGFQLVKRSMGM